MLNSAYSQKTQNETPNTQNEIAQIHHVIDVKLLRNMLKYIILYT
jgi:hypothetical protein